MKDCTAPAPHLELHFWVTTAFEGATEYCKVLTLLDVQTSIHDSTLRSLVRLVHAGLQFWLNCVPALGLLLLPSPVVWPRLRPELNHPWDEKCGRDWLRAFHGELDQPPLPRPPSKVLPYALALFLDVMEAPNTQPECGTEAPGCGKYSFFFCISNGTLWVTSSLPPCNYGAPHSFCWLYGDPRCLPCQSGPPFWNKTSRRTEA